MDINSFAATDAGTTGAIVDEQPFEVSGSAAAKLRELLAEEQDPDLKLRVFVTGGGCSGFKYGFTFDANSDDGDVAVSRDGVTVVVDPMSFQYLSGAEIDYREDASGAQFIIRNPNATTTCGCGSSFSV